MGLTHIFDIFGEERRHVLVVDVSDYKDASVSQWNMIVTPRACPFCNEVNMHCIKGVTALGPHVIQLRQAAACPFYADMSV